VKPISRNIVITEKQLALIHQGNMKDFIINMIKIGHSMGLKNEYIEHIKGPFKDEDSGELLFIVKIEED
jgi:hypothetical protein